MGFRTYLRPNWGPSGKVLALGNNKSVKILANFLPQIMKISKIDEIKLFTKVFARLLQNSKVVDCLPKLHPIAFQSLIKSE